MGRKVKHAKYRISKKNYVEYEKSIVYNLDNFIHYADCYGVSPTCTQHEYLQACKFYDSPIKLYFYGELAKKIRENLYDIHINIMSHCYPLRYMDRHLTIPEMLQVLDKFKRFICNKKGEIISLEKQNERSSKINKHAHMPKTIRTLRVIHEEVNSE